MIDDDEGAYFEPPVALKHQASAPVPRSSGQDYDSAEEMIQKKFQGGMDLRLIN